MKKIIASILALCIILSTVVSAFVISANDNDSESIITTKYIDLSLSDRLVYKNQDNTNNTAIKDFKPGKNLTMTVSNSSISSVAVGGTDAKEYSKQITLEYSKGDNYSGYFKVEDGKIYTVNVKYAAKATNSSKKLAVALVAANTPDGNDSTATTLAGKIFDNINTWNENQVLSTVIDASNTYVEAGDYLRIFVAGNGLVGIESVIIEEVDATDSDKVMTVNYNDGYCTRKQFTKTDEHIVPKFYGANDSVFDAWYTDSALTSKSNSPEANGTYYAKWTSVTRYADLHNANRIVEKWDNATSSNLPYQNGDSLTVSNLQNDGIKVVVSKSSSANYAAGATNVAFEGSNQLTLEYFDTDSSNLDGAYAGYVKLDPNKQYAVTVDYDVTSYSSTAKLAIAAFSSNVSKNNGTVIAGNNNITSVGSYTTYTTLKSGGLVDYTYGGGNASGWKLRLVFSGAATFVIKSVRIQEIYTADATAGNAIGIQYVEEGKTFKAAAIKKDGKWILPKPVLKGNVVDAQFDGWYKDASFTTALSQPALNDTYYAKWSSITRELDVANSNKMAVNDSVLTLTSPTDSKPLTVTINGSNMDSSGQHISLEYYDDDGNASTVKDENLNGYVRLLAGKLYAVAVKYKVTNVGATAPTIGLMNSKNGLSWASGQKNLGSATHSEKGEYVLSEIVGAGIDGAVANDRLRLVFNGQGTFEIESVTVTEIYSNSSVYPVEYVDGNNKTIAFLASGDELLVPETREGYTFEGWYNSSNTKITAASQLTNTTAPTTLTSKWLQGSTLYDIDLTISQVLDNTVGSSSTIAMTIEPDADNNDLLVDLNSGWNNIFKDTDGNIRTGVLWPDAYFALKLGTSTTDPAHFMKLQKDYKYTVNVEYEVLSASAEYNPQIAIVKNNATNSAGLNGSVVLNSNTHSAPGKYTLSAVVSNVDNVPLRLAFGGIGKINITSVKVNLEQKQDTSLFDITYIDGESSMSKFQKKGSDLYVPTMEDFQFVGWFTKNGEKVENTNDLNASLTLYAKWTGIKTTEIDLTNSQIIKDNQGSSETVIMELTPDDETKELTVKLNSGWNNIFRDAEGNLRTGTLGPDAIFALKYSKGSDPSDFVKLQKKYKYIVNVEYEVTSADSGYNPQIAIVRNINQNSAQNNGTIVLNSNTHSAPGTYSISAVVCNIDNIPLRMAFGGIGQIVIKKVTLMSVLASDELLFDITYNNGESNIANFRTAEEGLVVPVSDGFVFDGWFDANGDKVEDIVGVKTSLNLFAKWTGIKSFEVDLDKSQALKDKNGSGETVMEVKENSDDDSLDISLKSGWNNIFKDKEGNLRDGDLYPDAVLALKYNNASVPTSYIKLQKNYKYIINVDYKVIAADANFNPQIAIVRNKQTSSTGLNGAIVLNSNTHSTAGEYKLSAVVSKLDNIPIRLAFGGLGQIVINKITISAIQAKDDSFVAVTYYDGESNFAVFQNKESSMYTPAENGFIFDGWFDKNGDRVESTNGVDDSLTVYAKWTGVNSFAIDPSNSEALRFKNNSGDTVMSIEPKDDKSLEVSLNSGWNNIFKDKEGKLRLKTKDSNGNYVDNILWPDAILALKYDTGKEPTSYLKLQNKYDYVINIDYSVTSVYTDFAPQIAIVRNNQSNSTGINGSIVLNSNTHIEKGDYSLSAYVDNIDNIPIRLAFGGIGTIVIKQIRISYINTGDNYLHITYVDGDSNQTSFNPLNQSLSMPANDPTFKGWYKNAECIGKSIDYVTESTTVYAKRNLPAYTFDLGFDNKAEKDFYKQGNHTLSDFEKYGSKTQIVSGVGYKGSDAARLTYKRVDNDNTDYASNPMIALYDTNITEGEITDKRFIGKPNTQYEVTFKYKVENTDDMSLELYIGKRNRGQSANGDINDFGTGLWQIGDATKIGSTITEKTGKWVEVKAYFTASSGWFPVILLKTNNQTKSSKTSGKLASVLIDDIVVKEITPITEDTVLGVMDYEEYAAKNHTSGADDSVIGNKYALTVTDKENHTKKGKKALELTLMSDSLQYSGNAVVSINKEPIRTQRGSAYIVEFYVMAKTDIDGLIWGVNSVAGSYDSVTSKHNIEIRDKVDLKANKWKKITAYVPKLAGFEDAIGMMSIALAATGKDGTPVYIDDIKVKLQIESEVITFVDSDSDNPFISFAQRGFKGKKYNTLPSVSKDGYIFDGWFDTPACDGKEYKVSDKFPTNEDEVVMYAKWIDASALSAKDFTAGSFDANIYDDGVVPYENVCETSEESIYGINNVDSTQSGAWVKDSGIYGNGTAEYDGTLSLANDTYSKYLDTNGRNAIALINEDGTKFAVVKGEKYSIKFDYVNGSSQGTSYIQTVISTSNGYAGFGNGSGQGLKNIAVHGTDSDYQTYQEYFVADFTGYVYITFAARTDDGSPYRSLYHRIFVDNVEIKRDSEVKKINFIANGSVHRTIYGKTGDIFPMFDVIAGDESTAEFDGFYEDSNFTKLITKYEFTEADEQNIYIKYKDVKYTTPSDFSSPITVDFEQTNLLRDYYRQGKHMTYWFRGEANPEWQLITNDSKNSFEGKNYIKLNGYTTYWNEAKFVLYDEKNPSGTMLLEKNATYRVKVMTRCEDKYDLPKLTITLENPQKRYLLAGNTNVTLVSEEKEYNNGYMCYTADITVPDTLTYLPSLAIRKNQNDLQTLFIDSVSVEKIIDCKVTFEENGGTPIDDITVQIHELIADPGMPFKDGYDFKGWYSDKKMTKLWDFETMTVESDMTLYAKWEKAVVEDFVVDDSIVDDTMIEETETESKVPTMLEGDEHDYPTNNQNKGLSTWIIVLIIVGGIVVLLGVGALIWWLIARKKNRN